MKIVLLEQKLFYEYSTSCVKWKLRKWNLIHEGRQVSVTPKERNRFSGGNVKIAGNLKVRKDGSFECLYIFIC